MAWRPAHETHAIERFNVTLQFNDQVPLKTWQPIVAAVQERFLKEGFVAPAAAIGQPTGMAAVIMIGQAGLQVPILPQGQHDRLFVLSDEGTPREEARISRQQLALAVNRYNGWEALRARIEGVFDGLITQALQQVALSLVKMEYWDRFIFDGPIEDINYAELLSSKSVHVPSFPFSTKQLWHSHSGYFVEERRPLRLVNVNLDVADLASATEVVGGEEPRLQRSVGIYTMAQDAFSEGDQTDETGEAVLTRLDEIHDTLKRQLADIITEQMSNRIRLFQGFQQ